MHSPGALCIVGTLGTKQCSSKRDRQPMNSLGFYLILIAIGGSIAFIVILINKGAEARRKDQLAASKARAEREQEQALQMAAIIEAAGGDITKLPDLTEQVKNLVLRNGEHCYAICQGAQRIGEHHRTRYVGASAGVSIPVYKGIRVRTGRFAGQPVTTQFESVDDVGDLYITNMRVAFCGAREMVAIDGPKIGQVRVEADRLSVMATNRKTPLDLKLTTLYAPFVESVIRMLPSASSADISSRRRPSSSR